MTILQLAVYYGFLAFLLIGIGYRSKRIELIGVGFIIVGMTIAFAFVAALGRTHLAS